MIGAVFYYVMAKRFLWDQLWVRDRLSLRRTLQRSVVH